MLIIKTFGKTFLTLGIFLMPLFLLLPVEANAAGEKSCCIYQDSVGIAGCLNVQIPSGMAEPEEGGYESVLCKGDPAGLGELDSIDVIISPGYCNSPNNAKSDSEGGMGCNSPDGDKSNISSFNIIKKVWDDKITCAYYSGNKFVGCKQFTKSEQVKAGVEVGCPNVVNYSYEEFPGFKNLYLCSNPDKTASVDFENVFNNMSQVPTTEFEVAKGSQCCVYYTDINKDNIPHSKEVALCLSSIQKNGKSYCDATGGKINASQGKIGVASPKKCDVLELCVKTDKCCLVYDDIANPKNEYTDEDNLLQCSPAQVGCTLDLYYTANQAGQHPTVHNKQVEQKCGDIPACGGKILTNTQALQKVSQVQTQDKQEYDTATLGVTGPEKWTRQSCLKNKYHWEPPAGKKDLDEGPYCFVLPEVALQQEIFGVKAVTITGYVPLVFDLGFILLTLVSVGGLVGAGFQMRGAVDPQTIMAAKGLMIGSTVALGIGGGSFALLNTVSPATISGQPPAVMAVLPQEFDLGDLMSGLVGKELCCRGKLCLPETVEKGGKRSIKIGEEVFKYEVEADECTHMKGVGEFCRKGSIQEKECAKRGGECVFPASADPKNWGECGKAFNDVVSKVTTASEFAGWFSGPWFVVTSMFGSLQSSIDATIPGEGPLGACVIPKTSEKNGAKCWSNDQCASKKCVSYSETSNCFIEKEWGYCSSGDLFTNCEPNGNTLTGKKGLYIQQNTCREDYGCFYASDEDPRLYHDSYECSDGSLGSACGVPKSASGGYEVKYGTCADGSGCDQGSTCKGGAECKKTCGSGLECIEVKGNVRCLPSSNGPTAPCVQKTDFITRPDTCKFADVGLKCIGGDKIGETGTCSTLTQSFGAACVFDSKQGVGSSQGGVIIEQCKVKPSDSDLKSKLGKSVCYKGDYGFPTGVCGWYKRDVGGTTAFGWPLNNAGNFYPEDDEDDAMSLTLQFKKYEALCDVGPIKTLFENYAGAEFFQGKIISESVACTDAIKGKKSQVRKLLTEYYSKKNISDVESYVTGKMDGAEGVAACVWKPEYGGNKKIGKCGFVISVDMFTPNQYHFLFVPNK